MTHDPRCPAVRCSTWQQPWEEHTGCNCMRARHTCECLLLARADERGATNALDKARQLITALACPITIAEGHCEECEQYREVLACIESLRGKP